MPFIVLAFSFFFFASGVSFSCLFSAFFDVPGESLLGLLLGVASQR